MPDIETGVLPAGHPYARIGRGSRTVLYIPGLSFTAEPATVAATRRSWKRWLEPIARHDLTLVQVGRRADLSPGSSAADVADDYAAVIREQWGSAVALMGTSTGGHYSQWLAIRHSELVERLVLGFTAHRVPDDVKVRQRRAVDHFLAGEWRQGWALFGPWALPRFPRVASAALWLVGPYVGGRYSDVRVLAIDADSDDAHDSTAQLGEIHCPTLVASGGRDLAYPPELVRELVAGLPNARHIEYAAASHMGPGKVFAEDACAFLAGTESTLATAPVVA
jgi:pimeloyl-ACP methyl ester carboxylesterase